MQSSFTEVSHGTTTVEHSIEELSEIEAIVERGPDWNTIISIVTTLARAETPGLTVELSDPLQ